MPNKKTNVATLYLIMKRSANNEEIIVNYLFIYFRRVSDNNTSIIRIKLKYKTNIKSIKS